MGSSDRVARRDGPRSILNRFVGPGPLSQARIAERLGASKAMVNKLLQDLARGGSIALSSDGILLPRKPPPKR